MENVLHRKLQELLSQWCLMPSDVCGAGFGMGGVDTRRQHDLIAAMYTKMGFERFSLANDGILGIKAECDMTKTTLLHNVQRSLPDIQVTMKVSRSQPVLGALYWGCQVAGVPDDEIPHEAMQKALAQCLNPR